jgi:hypothetical protein
MCKFCEILKGKKETEELDMPCVTANIIGNVIDMDYSAYSVDSSFHEQWEINYCPMCGKELKKL